MDEVRAIGDGSSYAEQQRGRWEIDVRITVVPKHGDYDERVWEDAAVMVYRETEAQKDWTARQVAVDFLRCMADEIEAGELPPGEL